jgi:hypothetical protein
LGWGLTLDGAAGLLEGLLLHGPLRALLGLELLLLLLLLEHELLLLLGKELVGKKEWEITCCCWSIICWSWPDLLFEILCEERLFLTALVASGEM